MLDEPRQLRATNRQSVDEPITSHNLYGRANVLWRTYMSLSNPSADFGWYYFRDYNAWFCLQLMVCAPSDGLVDRFSDM